MRLSPEEFQKQASASVKQLWHAYLISRSEEKLEQVFQMLSEDFFLIGTGKHELFTSAQSAVQNVMDDQKNARDIQFEIIDEWYRYQPLDENLCMVYGTIWAREKTTMEKPFIVDMDTRFSVAVKQIDGRIQLMNIHHSIPSIDQLPGEHYPHTITDRANEIMKRNIILEERTHRDSLTSLYNRTYMEAMINDYLKAEEPAAFLMMDLDDFKRVNDTCGHLIGDRMLQCFAQVLKDCFRKDDLIGRIGGDEFVVLMKNMQDHNTVMRKAERVIQSFHNIERLDGSNVDVSCSIGVAFAPQDGSSFEKLYQHADEALYQQKKEQKGRCRFFR